MSGHCEARRAEPGLAQLTCHRSYGAGQAAPKNNPQGPRAPHSKPEVEAPCTGATQEAKGVQRAGERPALRVRRVGDLAGRGPLCSEGPNSESHWAPETGRAKTPRAYLASPSLRCTAPRAHAMPHLHHHREAPWPSCCHHVRPPSWAPARVLDTSCCPPLPTPFQGQSLNYLHLGKCHILCRLQRGAAPHERLKRHLGVSTGSLTQGWQVGFPSLAVPSGGETTIC